MAQCALLLTYYTPTIGDETNTQWLKTAIKSAREGRAHQYNSLSNNEVKGHKPASKRLWWCCILRDRIMSLGLRRPLEIKPKDFDFGLPSLSEEDLEGEIENSLVYSPSTKRVLVQLLTLLCDFAVVMNDILLLCYNPEPRRVKDPEQVRIVKQKVYQLEGWYDIAVSRFRELRQMPNVHKSASLFINAIYIYYLYVTLLILSFSFMLFSSATYIGILHPVRQKRAFMTGSCWRCLHTEIMELPVHTKLGMRLMKLTRLCAISPRAFDNLRNGTQQSTCQTHCKPPSFHGT